MPEPIRGGFVDSETYKSPDPDMLYAILYTEGEIDMKALEEECYKERWVPLLGLEPREGNGPLILLCVKDVTVGVNVIKRNMPKGWVPGLIEMPWQEIDHAKSIGWKIEVLTYPKRVMSHPDYKVVSLIHHFQEAPEYHQGGRTLK